MSELTKAARALHLAIQKRGQELDTMSMQPADPRDILDHARLLKALTQADELAGQLRDQLAIAAHLEGETQLVERELLV